MDDYIKREDALKLFAGGEKYPEGTFQRRLGELGERLVMQIPAVDIERRGEWEWDTADIYCCSVCGRKAHVEEVMFRPAWSFCPNCGAKMGQPND